MMAEDAVPPTWADADTDRLARLRTALAAERTVFAVIRT
jgi:uncharacterized membrane protein YidH (DUF202 family)